MSRMKKIVICIIILCIALNTVHAIAQSGTDLYAIQLGVFRNEDFADNLVKRLKAEGLYVYKISTSVHSVFYGIYTSQREALEEVAAARKHVSDAYVVKLSSRQQAIYLKEKGLADGSVQEPKEGLPDTPAELAPELIEQKQITIEEVNGNDLKYTYRVINDIELRGINGESKWFFDVDKGMGVRSFRFNLFCRVNELIRTDISYFTIYMNDIPVKSMRIKDANHDLLNSWTVDIPVRLVKEGYNELRVRSHSRITDDPCEDDKNIANWVIIDGNTNYEIIYRKKAQTNDISQFPRPFVGMYADDAEGVGIIIPENYSDKELSAALTLIAHIEAFSYSYEVPTALVTVGDEAISSFDSLIYLGNYKSVPQQFKGDIKNQADLYENNANIYKIISSSGQKPVFLIVSDNGDRLIEAIKALNNSDLKAQMKGSYNMLTPGLDTAIKEQRMDDYIYLTELGIDGIEVKGSNQQVASIGLRIPVNQVLANEACINLSLRYSDNMDFEKSVVSVYVNGVPIGSEKLEREKRDLDTMTFYIPEALRRNNYYDVRIVFELIPSGIIDCERYLASVPWAYINGESNYYFPRQERRLMLLDNLPFPFSRDEDLDSTTIVMPDKPKREDLRIAGQIAELTGIGIKNNEGIIDAITGNMLGEKNNRNNLVIFGTPAENSAIKSINDSLWFKYDSRFSGIMSNEKIELLPRTSTTATFLELKTSPYNENKGIMTLTSMDKVSLIKAVEYLDDSKRGFLRGDAAIISKEGDLLNFRFQEDPKDRPVFNVTQEFTEGTWDYLIFTGVLLLFLIIGLILYLHKNRRKNK
jgi:hypothetical protein